MASSGSYNFAVTRDDIIKQAYGEIGLYDPESDSGIDAALLTDAATKLNMLVKTWGKRYGLHLLQDVVLFLNPSQQSYLLGDASTDAHWCTIDDYNRVELTADAAAGAGTITVDDDDTIASADKIGVVLDDGTIDWTTVNGAPAANVVTLTATLDGAATSGNVVYTYTSRVVRPLRIVRDSVYRRDVDNSDVEVELVSKTDYDLLTGKSTDGKIIKVAYQPLLTSGRLWVWQPHDLATDTLRFTIERPVQDFDSTSDNPDLPVEASWALVLNLAVMLAPGNGAADELHGPTGLVVRAQAALDDWIDGDVENASVRFQPMVRR